jgi:magnesium-transporting ATPase (P-type)
MQFNNALIYILLAAAVLTALMGHWLDTWVILGVVIINAVVGFIQEDKAQKALDSIKNLLSLKATIFRGGTKRDIAAELLVPGDIVLLKAGDKVPADIRLISVSRFEVDESSLTGESVAVSKSIQPVQPDVALGDRESMAYAGTAVRTGNATGVVVTTAADTEVGKINTMLSETKSTSTPLMKKINGFGKALTVLVLSFSALLGAYAVFVTGAEWGDTLYKMIGLVVATVPEGLPAIITITLAIGVQRMARQNAIIRRLPSVETLGSVTVICSDKTGTLTKNEMTATNVYTASGDFAVSGLGYSPDGEITLEDTQYCVGYSVLRRLIQSARLCNSSAVIQEKETWIPVGAPTEAALITLARKAGYDGADADKICSIPFDSEFKYRAALIDIDGKRILFANGAPEKLKLMCGSQLTTAGTEPINIPFWEEKIEAAAAHGQRLIGCAYREVSSDYSRIEHEDLNENMIFAGITGIIDPPRPEAIESMRVCRDAGIRVKMITGDHVLTAREIALQMGLTDRPKVISGTELEEMNDEQMREAAISCDIFARTSPEHKLKLVKALQEQGEIVAMTGDGVNDAPALKKADIGVAMGIKGTEVTKDSAAMVLADDNFSSIVYAVKEGRTIYDNLRKTLLFILPTNGAQALVIVAAIIFGFVLPIVPVQILWVNMVTAITLSFALAFEPPERNVMRRPPRDPKELLIGGYFLFRIAYVSLIVTLLTIFFFYTYKGFTASNDLELTYARTVAVNMLVFGQLFYLFNCRKMYQTIFCKDFWVNRIAFIVSGILLLLQLGFTYLPFMQHWFGAAPLKPVDWLYLLAGGMVVLLVVEIEKTLTRSFSRNNVGT